MESDETMEETDEILSDYFAHKIGEVIDRLWKDDKINDQVVEEWKNEHMQISCHKQ